MFIDDVLLQEKVDSLKVSDFVVVKIKYLSESTLLQACETATKLTLKDNYAVQDKAIYFLCSKKIRHILSQTP